ncbi:MAG: glycosyltransferase [Proteobacteria bacterium]|nr:glycosyltransferase [Pseudomonadota bacterium]MCL2308447.1 glycosyltransferase [Pseudomonadota bacterium]
MSLPRVSVIVRSMARESLATALASLAAQTYPNLEILVVAACGPSHPPLEDRAGPHPLRLVTSETRLPRPLAANAGLEAATGEWITFLDDDDEFLPEHIAHLVDATTRADGAGIVHTLAQAVFNDGRREPFGQPFALIELYTRNFIHLSATLISRPLIESGCRFDPSLDIHEDWDFFLQCAQRTTFYFEPLQSYLWYVDAGSSGTAGGRNHDPERFVRFRDRVYEKWQAKHEALIAQVEPLLQDAAAAAQKEEWSEAHAKIEDVLALSFNDPWALNLRAMVARMQGHTAEALETQALATQVRPYDPAFLCNLGQLYLEQGDRQEARACAERALTLQSDYAPGRRLLGQVNRASLQDVAVG